MKEFLIAKAEARDEWLTGTYYLVEEITPEFVETLKKIISAVKGLPVFSVSLLADTLYFTKPEEISDKLNLVLSEINDEEGYIILPSDDNIMDEIEYICWIQNDFRTEAEQMKLYPDGDCLFSCYFKNTNIRIESQLVYFLDKFSNKGE